MITCRIYFVFNPIGKLFYNNRLKVLLAAVRQGVSRLFPQVLFVHDSNVLFIDYANALMNKINFTCILVG